MAKKSAKIKNHMTYTIIILAVVVVIGAFMTQYSSSKNEKNVVTTSSENTSEIKILPDGTKYLVHPDKLRNGGPPKGGIGIDRGIPAIADPKFETSKEATWLNENDLVLGLNYKGSVKAYPTRILTWHEIVNDVAGSDPIIVTYCPLCMSGLAFKSTINNKAVRFGVSGKLMNSNLVMYDESTDSYWNQLTGQAIIGKLTGTTLERVPIIPATWGDWKSKHSDTLVLSKNTGILRNYDFDPYESYFKSQDTFGTPFNDTRLGVKDLVFPVDIGNEIKVYAEKYVEKDNVINDVVGGENILVIWDLELNTVRIFKRGERIFSYKDGKIMAGRDEWDVNRLQKELEEFETFNTYWFSWVAFRPESKVYES
jgi:hypothetical protein